MNRIYDFFLDRKNNPMDYISWSSNSDFEKQVMNQLETFGYYETDFNELGNNYRTYWRELIDRINLRSKNKRTLAFLRGEEVNIVLLLAAPFPEL